MKGELNYLEELPNLYRDTINNVVEDAKSVFKDELISITLGGSCGKNNPITEWSDIDLYIVFKNYNTDLVKEFSEAVEKYELHVGVTFYSLTEIKTNNIDNKTKAMVYEKYYLNFNPTLYGNDVFLKITYDDIVRSDKNNIPNVMHEFRRLYINKLKETSVIDKKYIKKLLVLVKCYLNTKGKYTYGYKNVIVEFLNIYNEKALSTTIYNFDIIDAINDLDNTKKEVLEFSERAIKFIVEEMEENK